MRPTIGIDLGGTNLVGALVGADGEQLASHRWPSRVGDYQAAVTDIADLVVRLQRDALALGGPASSVGVAAAAFLDAERTHVVHAANLDWHDRPLLADLQERLDPPVVLANDADAAAWGEYAHGAGVGHRSLVLITVGTGVGGGVILDGRLITGAYGLGGELGHVAVVRDGRPCPCGGRGCVEQYASATALRRAAQQGARTRPMAAQRLLALAGGDVEAIDGPQIVAAAREGDAVALAAFEDVGGWLGVAIAHVVTILDPPAVLVGGGLAAAGELILAPARETYARHIGVPALHAGSPLRLARLGGRAGVIGAAALARSPGPHGPTDANRTHPNLPDSVGPT